MHCSLPRGDICRRTAGARFRSAVPGSLPARDGCARAQAGEGARGARPRIVCRRACRSDHQSAADQPVGVDQQIRILVRRRGWRLAPMLPMAVEWRDSAEYNEPGALRPRSGHQQRP